MMSFELDILELIDLIKLYEKAPGKVRYVVASMLNEFAFGVRGDAYYVIENQMKVRSKRFILGSLRVTKARSSQPVSIMHSIVGSIERNRFSGLKEQELGKQDPRKRLPTLVARRGRESNKVAPSLRMKPGIKYLSPKDFQGKTEDNKVILMLKILKKAKYKKPFIVRGSKFMGPGLYKFIRKKPMRIWSFDPKKKKVKRVRWLHGGQQKYFRSINMRHMWTGKMNWVFKKR